MIKKYQTIKVDKIIKTSDKENNPKEKDNEQNNSKENNEEVLQDK